MSKKRLLVLKMGDASPRVKELAGDYEEWFRDRFDEIRQDEMLSEGISEFEVVNHNMASGISPVDNFDAVVLTGSAYSAYEPLPWLALTRDYITQVMADEIPMLGVCFGHQLLAQALGGVVEKNPKGWEIGTSKVRLTEAGMADPIFEGFPRVFEIQVSHQDAVTTVPEGVTVLVTSPVDELHGFRINQRTWSIQFHPEIGPREVKALLESRVRALHLEAVDRGMAPGEFVRRSHEGVRPTDYGRRLLARFLTLALSESV